MGKVTELKPPPRTDVAAEVAPKLAAARERLGELEQEANAAALAAALNELGGAGKLAQLNGQLEATRRDVAQLEGALRLAEQRDAMAQAAIDLKRRREQLRVMERHADARLDAVTELCTALASASKAYARFLDETDAMALAMPTGMIPHPIAWHMVDIMLDGRPFPARIEVLIAGEMHRCADLSRQDRRSAAALPGAAPPVESQRLRPAAVEPATAAVQRMNEWLLGLVNERLAAIERADAARFAAA
jgi:hypothetical protein